MRGGGLRKRSLIAYVAYAACFIESAEAMFGAASMPMARYVFGTNPFTAGGPRFASFVATNTRSAILFGFAWNHLKALVANSGVRGPLDVAADMAGAHRGDSAKLQRAITAQVEQAERDRLEGEIAALPDDDVRRRAWRAQDGVTSHQIIVSGPTHAFKCSREEFHEMFTFFFGLESPAVRPYAQRGARLHTANDVARVVDAYGLELGIANLPNATFTLVHDALKHEIFDVMREAGFEPFVEPRHIFTNLIPPAVLMRLGGHGQSSIIPDAHMQIAMPPVGASARSRTLLPQRILLFDVKTLHGAGGIYMASRRALDEQAGAVADRATRVQAEYERHANRLDSTLSPQGTTPILDRLRSFTPVRALVIGNYGESSRDVHTLIQIAAEALAVKSWRAAGARGVEEYRSFAVASLRRRLGCFAAREYARHRLRRLPYIGVPRAAMRSREAQLQAAFHNRAAGDGARGDGVRMADFHHFQSAQPLPRE